MEKKMNSSINSAEAYAPPVMSFAGLENISQKQLWDVEQATHYQQLPYFLTDTPFLDSSATTLLPMSNYPFYQPTPAAGDCPGDLLTKGKEDGGAGRLGLNLGHRTYFPSPAGAAGIDWLFRRSRAGTHHQSSQLAAPPPRCQAEGCKADLSGAKYYHRRHKVCEFHSKATVVVVAGGVQQRFCQQCSRFHVLSEFDETKRSCRKRLADHNRRRRKPPPLTTTATAAATLEHSPPQDLNVTSSTQKSSKSIQDKSTTAEGTTTTTTTTVSSTVSTSNLSSPSLESPALSLGGAGGADNAAGFGFHSSSSNYHHHHYQMVHISSSSSSSSSSAFFNPHNFFRSSSNGASHSAATGEGPSDPANQHHHGGGGSNLLHLGQGLFEVDFI